MINRSKNKKTAFAVMVVVIGMSSLAYFSAPLYDYFCRVTGFGGTTQVAITGPAEHSDIDITVRFDANVAQKLPWEFYPEATTIETKLGKTEQIFYIAKNIGDETITGVASFNVSPSFFGEYFNKIQCFCFEEQTLEPGEEVRMPVLFFVDEAIKDGNLSRTSEEITLSYTFFPADGL